MIYDYLGRPTFADEFETVRIYDGDDFQCPFPRLTREEASDLKFSLTDGPFVLLSDYKALHDKVYGTTPADSCGQDDDWVVGAEEEMP